MYPVLIGEKCPAILIRTYRGHKHCHLKAAWHCKNTAVCFLFKSEPWSSLHCKQLLVKLELVIPNLSRTWKQEWIRYKNIYYTRWKLRITPLTQPPSDTNHAMGTRIQNINNISTKYQHIGCGKSSLIIENNDKYNDNG